MCQRSNAAQLFTDGRLSRVQIISRLKIKPVLRRLIERATEEQGKFGHNWTRMIDDMRHPHGRDARTLRFATSIFDVDAGSKQLK